MPIIVKVMTSSKVTDSKAPDHVRVTKMLDSSAALLPTKAPNP